MMLQSSEGRGRRLWAMMVKEGLQIIRDPSSILISIVLPLFLMFLYGYSVSLDLKHLTIGLVLEEQTPDTTNFANSLTNSQFFSVKTVRDVRSLIPEIEKGSIRGFVVVPSYFSEFRSHDHRVAPIQVVSDGSEPNTANFVQYYVAGAYQNWLAQEKLKNRLIEGPMIGVESRFWYNEPLESRYFLLPGSLAIIMTLIGTLLTALVVAREWERGTMEALISTPIQRGELIFGKLIPYFILGMISMSICFVVTVYGYRVPFRGSIPLLALVSSAFLFCSLGLGFMISTLARNQVVAYQISMVTGFLPAYILSGFLFEIYSMPLPIRLITFLIPARYFVQCLQTLFLVGNIWKLLLFNMIPMLVVGSLFFLIATYKTVKRLD